MPLPGSTATASYSSRRPTTTCRITAWIMPALVKLTLGHSLVTTLADDIGEACATLRKKGGLHELDRKRVKTGTGY